MAQFTRTRIRCPIFPAKVGSDFVTLVGPAPQLFKGAGCEFELAFMDGDALLDAGNIASVTVAVRPASNPSGAPLMLKSNVTAGTVINAGLELEAWQNGTDQHVVIPFLGGVGGETDIPAGNYLLVVSGFTTDNVIDPDVFGISKLKVIDAGLSNQVAPPVLPAIAATVDDIKGLLAGFVKKVMDPGDTITFTSSDKLVRRIIGVENANPAGAPQIKRIDDEELN